MYERKEEGNPQNTPEPGIVKAVQDEIKKMGDNVKGNYDELRKAHEVLKKVVDSTEGKFDGVVKAQITKLTEDITTRQDAIDQKVIEANKKVKGDLETKLDELATKRIDAVEAAMKRSPLGGVQSAEVIAQAEKDAKDFQLAAMVVGDKGDKGATFDRVRAMKVNVDEYKLYKTAFQIFLRKDERLISPDSVKALSVGIDPDGGYTVTPAMSARIITRLYERDPIRQLAAVESISTGAIEWLVDFDEAGWGWEGETETGDETGTPKLYKKRIPVHVMYAKPRATQTLLEDSGINIENWLADKVSNRFNRGEGAAFVTGNGVGKPRGFLTYGNYTSAGVDEWGKVERINMGAAAAVTADGYVKVKYSLVEDYLTRGTWLMNRLTVADTMYLKGGDGHYIWKPGLAEDKYATLLGLPVRMSTTMPTVAAGQLSVAIADWSEAYMIVDRLGITIQRDPFTAKPYVEFYTRKRVGGDVINFQAIKLGNIAV